MAAPAPVDAPARAPGRWPQLVARGGLLLLTLTAVALTLGGMLAHGRTRLVDWIGLGVAFVLAVAAAWIVVRPGRSTRIVCLVFLGVLMAGAPFLDYAPAVIRLYGFVLVNLAILWAVVPKLGLFLRRHLRYILLGIGLYLIALSFALSARDEWRRYHAPQPAESSPP